MIREFALVMELLTRLVGSEPLYQVHECVCGMLVFKSEQMDPRV